MTTMLRCLNFPERADKAVLIHTISPTGICSCSGGGYLFRSFKRRGCEGIRPKSTNIISFDTEKCVSFAYVQNAAVSDLADDTII